MRMFSLCSLDMFKHHAAARETPCLSEQGDAATVEV